MIKKIIMIFLMLTLLLLQSWTIEYPNFGIDPNKWYEGFFIQEAIRQIQMIAEQEIANTAEQVKTELTAQYVPIIEAQNKEIMTWKIIGISGIVGTVLSLSVLAIIQLN